MEKLVSKYSRAKRLQETVAANEQHASRELSYFYDGALVINARLPAEQGALIVKALEMAMDRQFEPAPVGARSPRGTAHADDSPDTDVSAETSRRIACDTSIVKLTKDKKGEILSIGRKFRGIPPAIRRADLRNALGCSGSHGLAPGGGCTF